MAHAHDAQKRQLTRRGFLAGVAAAAGTAILAACGGTESPTAAPTVAATRAAGSATSPTTAAGAASPAAASPAAASPAAASPAASAAAASPVAGAASPAASAASTGGASGGQISMYWTKPVTIHPLFSSAGVEQGAERQMFGALVRMTDKLEAIPDLAEKIDISPDAKVYTFTLKKGLAFSDGKPLTSKDVIFTYERAVDKRTGSYWRSRLLSIDGAAAYDGTVAGSKVKGLEAIDDLTVKMTLTTPDSTWLLTIGDFAGLCILPKHILEGQAPDQMAKAGFAFAPTPSAGAFVFDEWKADQYLAIKRNDTYAGGPKAKLDKIFLRVLTQQDVGIAQLEKGEIDLMSVPVTEAERLRKNPLLTVVSVPSPSVSFLAFNLDRPFLKDKRVRQAMYYAIDREGIVKEILKGEATLVNSTIIGPEWMGTPAGLNEYKFDPNKAKQLLKDANWSAGQKVGVLYGSDKINDAWMPILQQQFKDVGIALDLVLVDGTQSNQRVFQQATPQAPGDFDLDLVGGGVFREDPNVSAKYLETIAFTPAGANYGHYSNPKVDDLFKQGRATVDKAKRKEIYTQLAQIINDEVPWIYLWSPNSIHAYNKRLVGFKPPSYATHQVWNAEEWSVTK